MAFQNKSFLKRHEISEKVTYDIMENLYENKHIFAFFKTAVEEDKAGTDYAVRMVEDNTPVNIQFKTRHDRWQDLPICRFQPFRGIDNCTVGRDYKSIMSDKNQFYFVATQNLNKQYDKVSITETSKIKKLITDAENEWFPDGKVWDFFTNEIYQKYLQNKIRNKKLKTASNGVEAWFKKNHTEEFGKINIYIPVQHVDKIVDLNWRS
jgi:hypothetical protein